MKKILLSVLVLGVVMGVFALAKRSACPSNKTAAHCAPGCVWIPYIRACECPNRV